jgi:hypothetical protein
MSILRKVGNVSYKISEVANDLVKSYWMIPIHGQGAVKRRMYRRRQDGLAPVRERGLSVIN